MSCKKCKNPCTPCEQEEKCLGCEHYHSTECITLEEPFGTQPTGTNLTTTLAYIWTLLGNSGGAGEDGVGVQSAVINGTGNLIITLTNATTIDVGVVVGNDGQGIDHVSFMSSSEVAQIPGQAGAEDRYTIWGDVGETINLGIFSVHNGTDGVDATESTSTKFYFGTSYENPNDATVGVPLIDYIGVVIDNTTTITPPTKTIYFNTITKEIWTYNGTSWDNTTSIGNHLLKTEFDLVVGNTLPANETLIHAYSLPTNIEIGERIKARYIGRIKYGTHLEWKLFDGVSDDSIGLIEAGLYVQWNGDLSSGGLIVEINITRESDTQYYTSINGGIRIYTAGNELVLHPIQGTYIPLINMTKVLSDTTTPMTIRLYAFNSVSSANTINLQEISFEKIKF